MTNGMTNGTGGSDSDDINVLMRRGHPCIADGEELAIDLVERHCRRLGCPARILEIGCASGITSQRIAERLPDATITAHEEYAPYAALAAERLRGSRAELYSKP